MIFLIRYRLTIIPTILLLFTQSPLISQTSFVFSKISLENELSSKHITCFFQDNKGFMWIGTENGLNYYNANSIKIYKHNLSNNKSILNNQILNICQDAEENIWVSTEIGISKFNPTKQSFTNFTIDSKNSSIGYKPKAYSDRKGNIWIAGDGLFKFDKTKQHFNKINLTPSLRVNGFLEDRKGRIWLSSFNGLYLYNESSNTVKRFDTPPNDENSKRFGVIFLPAHEDAKGNLFVGTWSYGIFQILPEQGSLRNIETGTTCLNYASIHLNGKEVLWYASSQFNVYDKSTAKIYSLLTEPNNPFSRNNDGVSALYTDKQGQLWIGYASTGIQILNPNNQLIRTFPISNKYGSLRSINAFAEKDSYVYAGGWYADALCKLDKNNCIIQWWKHLPTNATKEASNLSQTYVDKQGIIWFTSFNGLIAFNPTNNTEKIYTFNPSISKNNRLLSIQPDGDSILWLSTYDNGLAKFSFKTQQLEPVTNNNSSLIWRIANVGNYVWGAYNGGSLLGYNKQKKQFEEFKYDSLTGQCIYYNIKYSKTNNTLYIACSNGLLQVQLSNMRAKLFTEKEGLPAIGCNVLEWQDENKLWVGTNEGLSLFNIQSNSFRNFYASNGLTFERIEQGLYKTTNNKLLIGAEGHIMELDASDIKESKEKVPVHITQVNESDSLLLAPFNKEKTIELHYFQNNLSFEFAMPDYINADGNRLFYKLDAWDKDFIQTKRGFARYSKLPPGKYIFQVKGISQDGTETGITDSIIIIIHPPFWKTWWFISLMILFGLGFLIYIVRYISQRNLKERLLKLEKEQAIEKERNRISRDMHDELGSGLTKIAIMSEVVKKQLEQPEKAKHQLENISASSRELVDNLQDIIWTLNPKNDTLESLAAYAREYTLKFLEPFEIELQFSAPDNLGNYKLSEEARRNLFLIIKETLNNSAKHAACSKIEIAVEANPIAIKISDNGKGFNQSSIRAFGNGLRNMQTRMEQINGTYTISSTINEGTTTLLQLNN